MKHATILIVALILTMQMFLMGCTVQQWKTTRDVLGAVAILGLAVVIERFWAWRPR